MPVHGLGPHFKEETEGNQQECCQVAKDGWPGEPVHPSEAIGPGRPWKGCQSSDEGESAGVVGGAVEAGEGAEVDSELLVRESVA